MGAARNSGRFPTRHELLDEIIEALKLQLDLKAGPDGRRVTVPDLQEEAYRLLLRKYGLAPVF